MRKYSEYENEQIRKKNDKNWWKWASVFAVLDFVHFFVVGHHD
jgi:hypothetical protein